MVQKLSYAAWKQAADEACYALAGLSIDDLADQPFYDWFESGKSPAAAAKKALKAEGF